MGRKSREGRITRWPCTVIIIASRVYRVFLYPHNTTCKTYCEKSRKAVSNVNVTSQKPNIMRLETQTGTAASRRSHFSASERRALEQALAETVRPALELGGGTAASRLHVVAEHLLGKPATGAAASSITASEQEQAVAELADAFQKALIDASRQRRRERADSSGSDDVQFLLGLVAQSLLVQSADAATSAALSGAACSSDTDSPARSAIAPSSPVRSSEGADSLASRRGASALSLSLAAPSPRDSAGATPTAVLSPAALSPVSVHSMCATSAPAIGGMTDAAAAAASLIRAAGHGISGQSTSDSPNVSQAVSPMRARAMRYSTESRSTFVSELGDDMSRRRRDRPSSDSQISNPGGDEVLGRLLKDVLRHKAKDTGVSISPDGWVTVEDALDYVNSFGHEYDEMTVRQEVADNPKRRFQLHDTSAGVFIRAAQGHTMHGVGEEIGTPLTKSKAPKLAVHGTYLKHLDTILSQGLSRMGRHHVHLGMPPRHCRHTHCRHASLLPARSHPPAPHPRRWRAQRAASWVNSASSAACARTRRSMCGSTSTQPWTRVSVSSRAVMGCSSAKDLMGCSRRPSSRW